MSYHRGSPWTILNEYTTMVQFSYHCGSSLDHVLSVVVAVSTEVHAARDPRERSLLRLRAIAESALLTGLLSGHLVVV